LQYSAVPSTCPLKRGKRGKFSPSPVTFGGPTIAEKYKVHQKAQFKKR